MKSFRIRSYSVQIRENADQNNSKYGHFLRSGNLSSYPLLLNTPILKSRIKRGRIANKKGWGRYVKKQLKGNKRGAYNKRVAFTILLQ